MAEPHGTAPRMTTSLSFTEGTFSSTVNPSDVTADEEVSFNYFLSLFLAGFQGSNALGDERQSRAASTSPG